jgi:hypothetical protein
MTPAEKRLLDATADFITDAGYNLDAKREAVRLAKAEVERERGWEVNHPQGRRTHNTHATESISTK